MNAPKTKRDADIVERIKNQFKPLTSAERRELERIRMWSQQQLKVDAL